MVDRDRLRDLGIALLHALGEDPTRDGLRDTPRRWADWWAEFLDHDPGRTEAVFEHAAADQMIVLVGVEVWSLCEHHLLPFRCVLTVAYLPTDGRVLGLSKIARAAHQAAHRLQTQERLVEDLADLLAERAAAESVAVLGRGEHLCMTIRGARTPGTFVTSVLRGAFRDDPRTRAEFLRLAETSR